MDLVGLGIFNLLLGKKPILFAIWNSAPKNGKQKPCIWYTDLG